MTDLDLNDFEMPIFNQDIEDAGDTPDAAKQLADLGFNVVIYPVTALRLAMKAVEEGLQVIKSEGTQTSLLNRMQTRSELYELLRYEDYTQFDNAVYNFRVPGNPKK